MLTQESVKSSWENLLRNGHAWKERSFSLSSLSALQVLEANLTRWMPGALQVMVDGYFPYVPEYAPQQAQECYTSLYHLLAEDPYEASGRSITFVALLPDPHEPGCLTVAATVRLIIGAERDPANGLAPVPAWDLLDLAADWPHQEEELRDEMIGELCRFCIAPAYRRVAVPLTQALSQAAFAKAAERHLRMIYAIMPEKLVRIVHCASFPFAEVPGVAFCQTEQARCYQDALPGYWQRQKPTLYLLSVSHCSSQEGGASHDSSTVSSS